MKKMYIHQGTVEKHDNINTDILVVKGHLIVSGTIKVKQIYGNGTIEANKIYAQSIVADLVEADVVSAKKVLVNKLLCTAANVSLGIVAKDYIEAYKIKTAKLVVSLSDIEITDANEIIHLKTKKRSFLGTLFASWLQEHFMSWKQSRIASKPKKTTKDDSSEKDTRDIEFEKTVSTYKSKCEKGEYRLVLEKLDTKTKASA